MKRLISVSVIPGIALFALASCGGGGGGGGGGKPATGTLQVSVVEAGVTPAAPVADARIVVSDGSSGEPLAVLVTDVDGYAEAKLAPATVILSVAAQGHEAAPPKLDVAPIPYDIVRGEATGANVRLFPLDDATGLGWVSGQVTAADGITGVADALVQYIDGELSRSTRSDTDGHFVLFNLPAPSAVLTVWRVGLNFPETEPITVTPGEETADIFIAASGEATGTVHGTLSYLAAENPNFAVDVTLTHPVTGEVIPGLRTFTGSGAATYQLDGVPDGIFNAIASMVTDGYVLDPDSVVKHGVPQVTLTGGAAVPDPLNFDLTGAIEMTSPVGRPEIPFGEDLTITWVKTSSYASAKFFVFEVLDESGTVLAGGFSPIGWWQDARDALTQTFDTSVLEPGRFYQVRIYALDDDGSTNAVPDIGDTILSASENLEGVFKVVASLACTNGIDDDGDGWIDSDDPDYLTNPREVGYGTTQCNDGIDNDADTLTDADDPQCESAIDESEAP